MNNIRSLPLYLRFKPLSPLGWYIVSSRVEKRRYRALFGLGGKMRVFGVGGCHPLLREKSPTPPLKSHLTQFIFLFFLFRFLFFSFLFSFYMPFSFFFFSREKIRRKKTFLIFSKSYPKWLQKNLDKQIFSIISYGFSVPLQSLVTGTVNRFFLGSSKGGEPPCHLRLTPKERVPLTLHPFLPSGNATLF